MRGKHVAPFRFAGLWLSRGWSVVEEATKKLGAANVPQVKKGKLQSAEASEVFA